MRKVLLLAMLNIVLIANAQNSSVLLNNEASILQPYINQFQSDENMLNRKYVLKRTEEYFGRMDQFYKDWLGQLKRIPFAKLSQNEKVDYLLLKRNISANDRNLKTAYQDFKSNRYLLPFASIIVDFGQKRRIGKQQLGAEVSAAFEQLKTQIETTRRAIDKKELSVNWKQANWAQQTVGQYTTAFTEAYKFYDGYDPQFTKATKNLYPEVIAALKSYATDLEKIAKQNTSLDDGTGIVGEPIGRLALIDGLKNEMIAYTPEQIAAIATAEEFTAEVKKEMETYYDAQSRNQIHDQIYHHFVDHTPMELPEGFLKRWLQTGGEKPKTEAEAEADYPSFAGQLKWTLVSSKLAADNKIEVMPDDIRDFAKQQLFSYMGGQLGALGDNQQWVEDYANRMMQDRKFVEDSYHRISTEKLFGIIETQVTAKEESISAEDFAKKLHNHHH